METELTFHISWMKLCLFFFYIYQAIEGRWNQRSLSIVGMLNISIKADDVLVPLLGGVQSSADEL